jgi:hypothetical protein
MRVLLLWLVLLTLPVAAVCWHWRVLQGSVPGTTPPDAGAPSPDHLVLLVGGQAASLRGANLLAGSRRDGDSNPGSRLAQVNQAPPAIPPAPDVDRETKPRRVPDPEQPPAKDPSAKQQATPPVKLAPRTTVLGDGETLYRVASRELGDGGRWREIAKLNRIAEASVGRIKAGARLELPRR